jgi:soluble lytic murein transglycosylase
VEEYPESDQAPAAIEAAAKLLAERGRPDAAADQYEALAERYPDAPQVPEALWQAGLLRFRLGEAARAAQAWERLHETGDDWQARADFWRAKAAIAAGEEVTATAILEEVAAEEGYYADRAEAYLAGNTAWPARSKERMTIPETEGDDLAWLRAAADVSETESFDPLALPDDPDLARGDELVALNLTGLALDAYRAVLERNRTPQALYALARYFADREFYSLSISAAQQLMTRLKFTPETAPPSLAVLAYPIPYETLLRETAERFDIDPLLLAALVYQESQWQPIAVSAAGARGLTQVMPATGREIAQRLGVEYADKHLSRPRVSLTFGGSYLDWTLKLFDDNAFAALAAYNGGAGNVNRWLVPDDDLFVESISLNETRLYIERVYDHWHAYVAIYRPGASPST